jgi:hypothetical protein
MAPADQIDLPGHTEPLKKEQAKKALTTATRSQSMAYYVDHPYKVESLNTKDPENWKIGLSFGDVAFSAEVLLDRE